jgi:alpha-beta hydrolase superfamily lysophospholipase
MPSYAPGAGPAVSTPPFTRITSPELARTSSYIITVLRIMRRDTSLKAGGRGAARLALGLPAGFAALTLLSARVAARRVVRPGPTEERFLTPWEFGIPYEEVSFRTRDGLRLRGWWLGRPDARRTVITLAGYKGAKHHTLGIAAALWRGGADVLLFDNRGRGDSEGEITTLGYLEQLDALAAIEYARTRSDAPLGLVGYSMGAAVAIMVAAGDERVGAVVADSPFASQRELLRAHLRRRIGLFSLPFALAAERFLPYDVREVEPIREVERISPRACLFIHGGRDTVTDPEDSRTLYARAGDPKELWIVEEADHCGSYFADRAAYAERVAGFLERHL